MEKHTILLMHLVNLEIGLVFLEEIIYSLILQQRVSITALLILKIEYYLRDYNYGC